MIEDAIRTLFWAIAKLFLSASDWMYDMLNAVVNLSRIRTFKKDS